MSAVAGERLRPLDMLERLVAFDTETAKSNLKLVDCVESYLRGWGVPTRRFPNGAGDKAALLATIGPADRPGIVLSGHTDTVPVEGQPWTGDPFRLRVLDGRAIARGATDMKGFDALALAAVPDWLSGGLRTPIHILLSYDEETTCLGSVDAIKTFGRDLPMPQAAVVGEPTELAVVDAHKSVVTFETTIHGHEAHSSKPYLGGSAVMAAGEFLHVLNRLADEMEARGDASGRFDPAYTTVHAGVVRGGTARNIVARRCLIKWEFRGLPDLDPAEIPARVEEASRQIERERLTRHGAFGRIATVNLESVPGLRPQPGSRAETIALDLTGQARPVTAPYGTEAGQFSRAGIPTVVCGPGSINSAHQPDEFITLDQLAAGEAFMQRLGELCAAG